MRRSNGNANVRRVDQHFGTSGDVIEVEGPVELDDRVRVRVSVVHQFDESTER